MSSCSFCICHPIRYLLARIRHSTNGSLWACWTTKFLNYPSLLPPSRDSQLLSTSRLLLLGRPRISSPNHIALPRDLSRTSQPSEPLALPRAHLTHVLTPPPPPPITHNRLHASPTPKVRACFWQHFDDRRPKSSFYPTCLDKENHNPSNLPEAGQEHEGS